MTAQLVPRQNLGEGGSALTPLLLSLEPWLTKLLGSDRIPAATAAEIPRARAQIRELLEPATMEQVAVEAAKLVEWGRAMGMAGKGLDPIAKAYLEDLRTIPADLLPTAIQRARAAHKFGNRLPLAAEIRMQVSDEMDRRYRLRMQLEKASRCAVEAAEPTPYRDMPPEQKAKVDAMIEGLKQGFRW